MSDELAVLVNDFPFGSSSCATNMNRGSYCRRGETVDLRCPNIVDFQFQRCVAD